MPSPELDATDYMWLSLLASGVVFVGLVVYNLLFPKTHPRDRHRPWDKLGD